jgi:hypothetical protein
VSEFVDSPFAHEPNKFSQFLTYQNFAAFDDVKIRHEGKEIYGRIKDFGYRVSKIFFVLISFLKTLFLYRPISKTKRLKKS